MSLFERFSNTFEAAKAWISPAAKEEDLPLTIPPVPVNIYYVDTLAKATEVEKAPNVPVALPAPAAPLGRVETQFEKMSLDINAELAKSIPNFDKMQSMIYKVIMMMMRMAAKSDMEDIKELNIKIKKQAYEIQGTYNQWQGLTITVISAGVSIAGGFAGLAPFIPGIDPETAKKLVMGSQAISSAGTSLQSLGGIFKEKSEGSRNLMQTFQRLLQDKEEERKSGKQNKNELLKGAKSNLDEVNRQDYQAKSGILS